MKKQIVFIRSIFLLISLIIFTLGCSASQCVYNTVENNILKHADSISKVLEKFNSAEMRISDTFSGAENISEKSKKELKGKPDTIVIEFDSNNKLLIPGMLPSAYADKNPTDEMYVPYSYVQKNDKLSFILSEISGIEGTIAGNELFFETGNDFKLISVNCTAFAGIFFNEDGSGGVWQEFEDTEYRKEPAKKVEEKIYEVPLFEGIEEIIPNALIEKADKKTDENDLLTYDIYFTKITVDIQYLLKGKKYKKTLIFNYEYGD